MKSPTYFAARGSCAGSSRAFILAMLLPTLSLLSSAGLAATAAAAKPAEKAPAAPPVPLIVPKSEFVDDFKSSGRDPFFPSSRRRNPAPVEPAKTTDAAKTGAKGASPAAGVAPALPSDFASSLALTGITKSPKGKRFAIINGRTFAQGESYLIRTPAGTNMVTCVDIRDGKAVLQIEGVPGLRTNYLRRLDAVEIR